MKTSGQLSFSSHRDFLLVLLNLCALNVYEIMNAQACWKQTFCLLIYAGQICYGQIDKKNIKNLTLGPAILSLSLKV